MAKKPKEGQEIWVRQIDQNNELTPWYKATFHGFNISNKVLTLDDDFVAIWDEYSLINPDKS